MLADDTDPDGDKLTLATVTNGPHGSADVVDGKVTYTPDAGWAGVDTVTYTVTDGDLRHRHPHRHHRRRPARQPRAEGG